MLMDCCLCLKILILAVPSGSLPSGLLEIHMLVNNANGLTDEYVTVDGVRLREADGVQFDYFRLLKQS